jgi:DNA-binding response OmpR family regulator
MPASDVWVSTIENRIVYNGHDIKLPGRLINLAAVLAKRIGNAVTRDAIISQMWGNQEGDFADTSLSVACMQLRKRLKPIGLVIVTTWGVGYRMAKVSKTERFSTSTGAEHAAA